METEMTKQEATKIAIDRVSVVKQGDQYVVHTWSPKHNATFVSHRMSRFAATRAARETRMRMAIDLMAGKPVAYIPAVTP
jgi:hypothetical protein